MAGRYNWDNITLIGMPACGKSTVGVLLAKRLGYEFIDGDILIQNKEKRLLKTIIEQEGLEGFMRIENAVNANILAHHAVIAPGGSVIYGGEAMEHLKSIGTIVYLSMEYEDMEHRLGNLKDRGVVLRDGMTLRQMYDERAALYAQWADITINCTGVQFGRIVDELRMMAEWG